MLLLRNSQHIIIIIETYIFPYIYNSKNKEKQTTKENFEKRKNLAISTSWYCHWRKIYRD